MSDEETDKLEEAPIDSPVMAKLIAELGDKPVEHWLARDPRVLGDLRFQQAIIRAQDQMLAEQTRHKYSAKEVLQIYEERRKTDRKLQLKTLCEELGANYNSILAAKSRMKKQKHRRKKK